MGSEFKVEKWNDHKIRFVFKDGEWWAVAKDIATALGYKKTNDVSSERNTKCNTIDSSF